MKSFFMNKQLKNCDSKCTGWLRPFRTGINLCLAMLLTFFISSRLNAQLCPGAGPIFIDGNPAEWPAALNNAANTKKAFTRDVNSELDKGVLDDGYTQGTSNNQPIAEWRWVYGQTNAKGDIENAGALLLGNKLYFFGDRSAFNGTCEIGFWFLIDKVAPTGDGGTPGSPFSGEHKNGDLLVLNTFTSGGSAATPKVFIWQGNDATGSLVEIFPSSCSRTNGAPPDGGTTYIAPGGVNGTVINIPPPGASTGTQLWKFASKAVGNTNRDPGNYYPPLFFEGVVDLGSITGASLCFQSFIMKTTTSANNTAANVDLVAGEFSGIPDPPEVVGDEKCFGFAATATASCTGSTAQWYNATTNALVTTGASLTLPVGTTAGTYNYNVTCKTEDGCESAPRAVSIIINPTPTVDGLITIEDGVTLEDDDLYRIKISRATTAHLYVNNPVATSTYVWTRINCTDETAFAGDAATSFSATGSTATFNILSTTGLADLYCFKVRVTDNKGCVAEDIVRIIPDASAIPCQVNGPGIVCAGSNSNGYTYLDGLSVLNPDFNYTWSISGNGTINGAPQVNVNSVTVTAGAGAGSYTVTMTITGKYNSLQDPDPCSKTTNVTLITLLLDKDDVNCYGGSDGTVTATFSGGTAPYKAQIDGGTYVDPATSGHIFTGLAQGSHTVHVVDVNGCEASNQITVGQPPVLSCNLTTPTILTCGSSGTVTGTITGGTAAYSCSASFDAAGVNGGWSVSNCSVSGSGISVSYTSGLSATSAVMTVTVTDANGCTSTCSITVQCTGGQSCSPGFWRNQTQYWDQQTDVAVNNMPGTLTNPVTPGGTFISTTNFWAYFDIPVNKCGLSTNANLTMAQAMINNNLSNVDCKNLVFHGIANLLSAALLPNTYPFPAGSGGNFAGLYTQIRNAFLNCDCDGLGSTLGAISALHTGTYCQDAANALNSFVSRDISRPAIDDGGIEVAAYPNPYNNVVNFKFASPTSGKAVLEVYDIVGRKLAVVYQGNVKANIPQNVKYNVPAVNRVQLIYKLTVNDKAVRGNILPDKN